MSGLDLFEALADNEQFRDLWFRTEASERAVRELDASVRDETSGNVLQRLSRRRKIRALEARLDEARGEALSLRRQLESAVAALGLEIEPEHGLETKRSAARIFRIAPRAAMRLTARSAAVALAVIILGAAVAFVAGWLGSPSPAKATAERHAPPARQQTPWWFDSVLASLRTDHAARAVVRARALGQVRSVRSR